MLKVFQRDLYCKCKTCTIYNCDDCTTCDICMCETGCSFSDDEEREEYLKSQEANK